MRLWVGGYGPDHKGAPGEGIGSLRAGALDDASAGGPLAFTGTVAPAPSPSWVAPHPTLDVLYAALEEQGTVQAFRRTGEERFVPLGAPVPVGPALCHVAVAPDGSALLASAWGDGTLARIPLDAAGTPGAAVVLPVAEDPYAGGVPEPRTSRAHQARFLPGGLVATTDLGWDTVRLWREGAGGMREIQRLTLPFESGPRHTVWHPSGHLYVLTELSREVFVLAPDGSGQWRLVGGAPAAAGSLDGDTAAELAMSRDGEFLYAGIRGSDTLGVLRVRGAGEALEPVALVEAGVGKPRHHVVVRDTLLVAGQGTDEVASLTLDLRTGVPGRVRHRTPVPAPTCLLPVR